MDVDQASQDVAAPPAPTITERPDNALAVSWSDVPLVTTYRLSRSGGGGNVLLATVTGATSYIDIDVTQGVQYCYSIVAVAQDGAQSDPSAQRCGTVAGDAPSTDQVIAINSTAFSSPNWHPVSSAMVASSSIGTADAVLTGSMPMHTGDVVKAVTFQARGSGILSASVLATDGVMQETSIGGGGFNGSGAWTLVTVDVIDTTMSAYGALSFRFTANSGPSPMQIGNVSIQYTPAP